MNVIISRNTISCSAMLGDLVFETEGKVIGMKRLPNGKIEQKAALRGTILDEECSVDWIGMAEHRPDGTGFVQFHGIFSTTSGVELEYTGIGNGVRKPDKHMVYRGAVCFSTPPGKFAHLNGIAVVWEVEVDEAGFVQNKGWEWK